MRHIDDDTKTVAFSDDIGSERSERRNVCRGATLSSTRRHYELLQTAQRRDKVVHLMRQLHETEIAFVSFLDPLQFSFDPVGAFASLDDDGRFARMRGLQV